MMVANLMPEVKNLDADHTFGDEAMKKTILAWEVLKKSTFCPPPIKSELSRPALEPRERLSHDLEFKQSGIQKRIYRFRCRRASSLHIAHVCKHLSLIHI